MDSSKEGLKRYLVTLHRAVAGIASWTSVLSEVSGASVQTIHTKESQKLETKSYEKLNSGNP
jgi:hypothetical protein